MAKWWRRIRGAAATGLLWAVVWAPMAVIIGTQLIDPTDSMDEMWVMVGALPGFVSGVIFSGILGIAAHRRRLDELSVRRTGAWGALSGSITGIIPFLIGSANGNAWLLAAIIIPTFAVVSGLSAAASLALAQRGDASVAPETCGVGSESLDGRLTDSDRRLTNMSPHSVHSRTSAAVDMPHSHPISVRAHSVR